MHLQSPGTGKLIILTLAEEPSLSAKQIYLRILRQGGRAISYQAVHKKIAAMESEGIIIKNAHNYSISPEWLNDLSHLIEMAKNNTSEACSEVTEVTPIRQMRMHFDSKYKGVPHAQGTFLLGPNQDE